MVCISCHTKSKLVKLHDYIKADMNFHVNQIDQTQNFTLL